VGSGQNLNLSIATRVDSGPFQLRHRVSPMSHHPPRIEQRPDGTVVLSRTHAGQYFVQLVACSALFIAGLVVILLDPTARRFSTIDLTTKLTAGAGLLLLWYCRYWFRVSRVVVQEGRAWFPPSEERLPYRLIAHEVTSRFGLRRITTSVVVLYTEKGRFVVANGETGEQLGECFRAVEFLATDEVETGADLLERYGPLI